MARRSIPKRADTTNKAKQGKALRFAGQKGMWGAAILATTGAYRMGAGYVYLASFDEPGEVIANVPDILTLDAGAIDSFDSYSSIAIGPGFGKGERTHQIIKRLKEEYRGPVLLDADALSTLAESGERELPGNWVLTPHAGELSRIMGITSQEIEEDRCSAALKASQLTGALVLLKGFRSVLSDGKRATIIGAGNSALATAGSGDVLAGMVVGLLAQGVPCLEAAACGAYLHGRTAEEWVRQGQSSAGFCASDIKDMLPGIMERISQDRLGR
jgi:NAD(P)H-hydrate epimerase